MIIPDVNLLLYAYDEASPSHGPAVTWLQRCMGGDEPVGLTKAAIFGFLRVGTSPRVFDHPMTVAEAAGHVRGWLEQPVVRVLDSTPRHVELVLALLEQAGTAANLVTDAQIAAAAIEHSGIVHTTDADFARFPDVRWFNPLTRAASRGVKPPSTR